MGIQLDLKKELKTVVEKVTSARFIISVMIIWTICYVTIEAMALLVKSANNPEFFSVVKEVFIYLMGIVSGIAGSVVTLYFTRTDRNGKPEEPSAPGVTKQ